MMMHMVQPRDIMTRCSTKVVEAARARYARWVEQKNNNTADGRKLVHKRKCMELNFNPQEDQKKKKKKTNVILVLILPTLFCHGGGGY